MSLGVRLLDAPVALTGQGGDKRRDTAAGDGPRTLGGRLEGRGGHGGMSLVNTGELSVVRGPFAGAGKLTFTSHQHTNNQFIRLSRTTHACWSQGCSFAPRGRKKEKRTTKPTPAIAANHSCWQAPGGWAASQLGGGQGRCTLLGGTCEALQILIPPLEVLGSH